ncbi:MAG: RidA family protein [Alphaproteobacteria bacterium]|nr:RidA family protein [Alphaproteobacteria bacterium]
MVRYLNPASIAAPIGRYTHGVETSPGMRQLHVSGQVGLSPDGKLPAGIADQAENVWRNIEAILAAAGMGIGDLVRVNTFLVDAAHVGESRAVRLRHLGEHRPASTLLVVAALAAPEYLIEIEALAAAPVRAARTGRKPAKRAPKRVAKRPRPARRG